MQETFLQTHDVAKRLDISSEYVRKLERSGRLPAIKTESGQRIFRSEDVEKLAAERAHAKEQKAARAA